MKLEYENYLTAVNHIHHKVEWKIRQIKDLIEKNFETPTFFSSAIGKLCSRTVKYYQQLSVGFM